MALASPRPDLEGYDLAMRSDFATVVGQLEELLGAKLVAYLADVRETRAVKQWAQGERSARGEVEERLRLALQVAHMIAKTDTAAVARAWFRGLNPQLDDQSPARMLREEEFDKAGPLVLSAARAFVVGG